MCACQWCCRLVPTVIVLHTQTAADLEKKCKEEGIAVEFFGSLGIESDPKPKLEAIMVC